MHAFISTHLRTSGVGWKQKLQFWIYAEFYPVVYTRLGFNPQSSSSCSVAPSLTSTFNIPSVLLMVLRPISFNAETYLLMLKTCNKTLPVKGKQCLRARLERRLSKIRSQTTGTRLMHLTTQQHAAVRSRAERHSSV